MTTTRPRTRTLRISAGAALLAVSFVGLVACGGDDSPARPVERPLTVDEASLLASVQFDNYDDGGADFQVATAFLTTNETLNLQGVVDWENHVGYAVASGTGGEAGITEVFWTRSVVLERRPAADALLAGLGYRGVKYFLRAPEPEKRLLDRALAIVTGLASTQRDNPQLIQQKEGSAFLRLDTLRERPASVMRFGERNVHWIDSETNRMLRFEGNAAGGGAPTLVDIINRGKRTVPLPSESEVIATELVAELYDGLRAASGADPATQGSAP